MINFGGFGKDAKNKIYDGLIEKLEEMAKSADLAKLIKSEGLIDVTGVKLTPSYHGEKCQGNGEHPGFEICCENCEFYYTVCFPDEWPEEMNK